jgi:hypothetical protein
VKQALRCRTLNALVRSQNQVLRIKSRIVVSISKRLLAGNEGMCNWLIANC